MRLRRWESLAIAYEGNRQIEVRIGKHFTRRTAKFRIGWEPSTTTVAALAFWNTVHPERRIDGVRYEVRRTEVL